jgi:hypothetical protein
MGLTTDCAAVVGLLRALKMFKYFSVRCAAHGSARAWADASCPLQLVKALNVLWMTINRAFETLVYFCVRCVTLSDVLALCVSVGNAGDRSCVWLTAL